jgi:hypothetical protein
MSIVSHFLVLVWETTDAHTRSQIVIINAKVKRVKGDEFWRQSGQE